VYYPDSQKKINSSINIDDISRDVLLKLYGTMLKIRNVQLKIAELYHEDEMKTPVHLCIGQEAVAAGVCANLGVNDYVFSNHRGHGHYIAKGGNLKAMIAELYNKEGGCSKGRGGSMHLLDTSVGLAGSSSIVGGGIPIATGAALSAAMQKNKRVSVSFFGDAAVEEGVLYESINFAVLKKLPVIYVCENNFYAVFSPLKNRQATDDIYRRFEGLSIPGYKVDGNNVIDVYKVAQEAIDRARNGRGPSFIECRTYRQRDHHGTGSGVEVGYRIQKEVDEWAENCPLETYYSLLMQNGIIDNEENLKLQEKCNQEIDEAFEFAQSCPLPNKEDILKYLYQ